MALPRGWKTAVLRGIGAPVNQNNLALLRAWQQAEGGGTANNANFNPLNTTQPARGAGSINSVGVRSYRSAQQGIQATVQTLLNGHYTNVIHALRSGAAPSVTAQAIADSPWGTGGGVLRVLGSGGGGGGGATTSRSSFNPPPSPDLPFSITTPKPYSPVSLLTSNLGKIASGWQPTDLLANLAPGLLRSLSPTPSGALPQVGTQQTGGEAPGMGPGGSWGGSYQPATQLAKVGEKFGLTSTSQKRETKMTTSGNVSDHWVGSKNAYAYDLSGGVGQMDRAAKAIAARLGLPYKIGQPLVATKVEHGLRYQVLYRTTIGGNHFTHIHLGVKRV